MITVISTQFGGEKLLGRIDDNHPYLRITEPFSEAFDPSENATKFTTIAGTTEIQIISFSDHALDAAERQQLCDGVAEWCAENKIVAE